MTPADRVALFGPPATIPGVVRYRGELAQRGLRLTRFLVHISQPDQRCAFLADEEAGMAAAGLSEAERAMVRERDYVAMLAHGVNIYALARGGAVFGHVVPEIGRRMREGSAPIGETRHG